MVSKDFLEIICLSTEAEGIFIQLLKYVSDISKFTDDTDIYIECQELIKKIKNG